ncbi:hypothetical protein, partial [Methylobacterium sp. Leaf106]|uniref:hypothetical protein n=1 Tax=Methylobacterium sp. Leaf106 TaxID=1736255 RepID=UPI000ADD8C2B
SSRPRIARPHTVSDRVNHLRDKPASDFFSSLLERTFGQRYGDRAIDGEPFVPLALLQETAAREKLFTIWQSFVDRIQAGV